MLGVDEHTAVAQALVHAAEQVALVGVLEVVDRERGDDRIEGPLGQLVAQVRDDGGGRATRQALARVREHLRRAVEEHELGGRIAVAHRSAHQPGAGAEVQHAIDRSLAQADYVHGRAVEELERRQQRAAAAARRTRAHAPRRRSPSRSSRLYAITYNRVGELGCPAPENAIEHLTPICKLPANRLGCVALL